jgi:hypothetical protein
MKFMKKVLLGLAALACLLAISAPAAPFWYDTIQDYPVGGLTTNTSLWFDHPPGSLTYKDLLIVTNTYTSGAALDGKRLRVNGLNSEYAMRLFDPVLTNSVSSGAVYASFIVNASYVPSVGNGSYFACFNGVYPFAPTDGTSATNSFQFRGRVFEVAPANAWPFTNSAPLTYRIGVANAQDNEGTSPNPGPNQVIPIDLAKNVDYQVVLKYDIDNVMAYVWVNPASESDTANMAGPTSDLGSITNGLAGLLFRQRYGGTMDIRDVVVGTSFDDVMTNTCGPVLVATNFNVVSNYSGNPALLEVFATSIGGGPLSYKWYQISGGVTNPVGGNSQKYLVPSISASDAAYYFCAVTNSCGQGAVSSTNFQILVNTTGTAPAFSLEPVSGTNLANSVATLTCTAAGTGPLSYTWKYNNTTTVTDGAKTDGTVIYGSQTPSLTLSNIAVSQAGSYSVTVSGGVAPAVTSSNAVITVTTPAPEPIAYIRTLVDTNTWQPTNTYATHTIQGVITVYTNFLAENIALASYYIQDDTAGINLYVTGTSTGWRPQLGDIVKAVGHLYTYNNNIEFEVETSFYAWNFVQIIGHTNSLPAPFVFTPSLTNNPSLMETNIEGRLIMLTNVFFPTNNTMNLTGNRSWFVTNGGSLFLLNFPGGSDQDVRNHTMWTNFAWTVTGPCVQFRSGAYTNVGYQLNVSRWADIVTNPPPAPIVSASLSTNNLVLKWPAVPYDISIGGGGGYAYSVWSSADVGGSYQPLVTGLTFSTTNGIYTHTNALLSGQKFYRVSSP